MDFGPGTASDTGGDASPVLVALDRFRVGLDDLVKIVDDGALEGFDDAGLVGFLQSFEQVRNRLPLVDHRVIAEAMARDLPGSLTQSSMNQVLVAALRLSPGEAARRVRAAAAVGDRVSMLGEPLAPRRPVLASAQRTGEVSPEQVQLIERALAKVDRRGFDPADLDAGERLLTAHAHTFGPKQLARLAERVVDGIDPDGSRPADEVNADRRHLHLRPTRDGAWTGEFRLTGGLGVKLQALLGPLAKPRVNTTRAPDGGMVEHADQRHHGQRLHDALEEICDRLLRADPPPDAGGSPATVIITIDVADLLNGTGYGISSDGTLLRTEQVVKLADQAEVYYAFLDRHGTVLNLGRTRRIASRPQTLALTARDHGCSFPGCDRSPEWCERHHVVAWIDGGTTDLNNLTLLCRFHHHNFASRGWTCRINRSRPARMDPTPLGRPRANTDDQPPHHRHPRRPPTPTTVSR